MDLDFPSQKMFHPLPPSLGPGVYLGAVERATSFISDDRWYGTFAGTNPGKTGLCFDLSCFKGFKLHKERAFAACLW